MAQGEPEKKSAAAEDRWWQIAPPAVLGLLVLWLGLTMPAKLSGVLHQIAVNAREARR